MTATPSTDDPRYERLITVIRKARQRQSDRLVIKTMRVASWGLGIIALIFVVYIVVALAVGMHDNRRIDTLERRIETLERH